MILGIPDQYPYRGIFLIIWINYCAEEIQLSVKTMSTPPPPPPPPRTLGRPPPRTLGRPAARSRGGPQRLRGGGSRGARPGRGGRLRACPPPPSPHTRPVRPPPAPDAREFSSEHLVGGVTVTTAKDCLMPIFPLLKTLVLVSCTYLSVLVSTESITMGTIRLVSIMLCAALPLKMWGVKSSLSSLIRSLEFSA